MSRIAIETAKRVSQAWGVFEVSKDGAKVQPSEAYALDESGNLISGDGADITAHIASGGAFVTYDGFLTNNEARVVADDVNASHARGVAEYGWQDDGSRCEARPLPVGTVFYVDEVAHVVAAPAKVRTVTRIDEFTKVYRVSNLTCEVRTSDSFVTVSRDGKPVATLQRRRAYSDGPAWRMVALDGVELAAFHSDFDTLLGLLRRGALALITQRHNCA